ncbi:unnamed protein product [Trichobilharzia szidati]|nr:unnamed protein product [Trichobilharzia szidati]
MSELSCHCKCRRKVSFFLHVFLFYYLFFLNSGVTGFNYAKRTYVRNLLGNHFHPLHRFPYHHFYNNNYRNRPLWRDNYSANSKSRIYNDHVTSFHEYCNKSHVQCNQLAGKLFFRKYMRFLTYSRQQKRQTLTTNPDGVYQHFSLYDLHKSSPDFKQHSFFKVSNAPNYISFYSEGKNLRNIYHLIESNQISLSKWLNQLFHLTNLTKIFDLTEKFTHFIINVAYERVKLILFCEFKETLQKLYEMRWPKEQFYTKSSSSSSISKELLRNSIYNKLYSEYVFNKIDVPITSIKPKLIQSIFNEIDYNGDGIFTPSELEIFLQFHEIIP